MMDRNPIFKCDRSSSGMIIIVRKDTVNMWETNILVRRGISLKNILRR